MAGGWRLTDAVGRFLTAASCVLEGGAGAATSMNELVRRPDPEILLALRLCASEALVAYDVSGRAPGTLLLQAIVRAIIALPKLPCTRRTAEATDRATAFLLKRNGVSGFACRKSDWDPSAPAIDPTQLLEWAAACSPLAVPKMTSYQRSTFRKRRMELLEAIALSLMESEPTLASSGLRWLAVLRPSAGDAPLVVAGVRRALQLGMAVPQVRFNCCLATKLLGIRKQ